MQRHKKTLGKEPKSSEITPEAVFRSHSVLRRQVLTALGYGGAASAMGYIAAKQYLPFEKGSLVYAANTSLHSVPSRYTLPDAQTPVSKFTTYNNFYEFGTDKSDPARNAHSLRVRPWTIRVTGLVKKPQTVNIDDLVAYRPIESRVYRHRCVEAWSMVIPWDGYSLSEFINFCQPLSSAKFVEFVTLSDRQQMPDPPSGYSWPYREGLRIDEAMHPLTLLTFGSYGSALPNQNGAPVRIVVPWKYGFKGGKSVVEIHFTDKQPRTTWNEKAPSEYGFYANVNPEVDHPRWSQAHERRIDSSAFPHTVPSLMFNGYADQVAGLYRGMNLHENY